MKHVIVSNKRKALSVTLPRDLLEWLTKYSDERGQPMSYVVEEALRLYREIEERNLKPHVIAVIHGVVKPQT